jgi:putative two-component system response regulator
VPAIAFAGEIVHTSIHDNRILLVDDAPENLYILSECLRDKYTLMVARNGEDALRLAVQDPPPDLILLDVVMPGMDGYEVCRRLKQADETCNIPIMFITAQDEEREEARGFALGAQDYITKPFRASLVRNRVASQIQYKLYRDHLSELVEKRTEELTLTQETTIHAMASLAEWRDPETGVHIKRTQTYVKVLAMHLASLPQYAELLTSDYIFWLSLSAPLHDVGKVAIPDSILRKPGRLTKEEFEIMKGHATYGYQVLSSAGELLGEHSFLHLASEIAYCHHERWDGGGYPRALKGDEIPLSARLMSLADVYDALRSRRVYKPSMSHEKAASIIFEGRGTQFCPDVIDAFDELQDKFIAIANMYPDEA